MTEPTLGVKVLPQLDAATVKAGEPEDVRAWLDSRRADGVTAFQPLAPAHVADPRGPEFTRINQHDAIVLPAGVPSRGGEQT